MYDEGTKWNLALFSCNGWKQKKPDAGVHRVSENHERLTTNLSASRFPVTATQFRKKNP